MEEGRVLRAPFLVIGYIWLNLEVRKVIPLFFVIFTNTLARAPQMKLFYLFIVFLVYISCAKAQTIDWTLCPTNGKRKLLRIDTLTLFL
jgi:hypothetical protein